MGIVQGSWDRFSIARRERLWQRAFLSLGIGLAAAVAIFPLRFAEFIANYAYCGDQSGCEVPTMYVPGMIFSGLERVAVLVAVVCLIRAVVLFVFAAESE